MTFTRPKDITAEQLMGDGEEDLLLQGDTRAYILDMLTQLAEMASRCGEAGIAKGITEIVGDRRMITFRSRPDRTGKARKHVAEPDC